MKEETENVSLQGNAGLVDGRKSLLSLRSSIALLSCSRTGCLLIKTWDPLQNILNLKLLPRLP
jgi:hypothetical protein